MNLLHTTRLGLLTAASLLLAAPAFAQPAPAAGGGAPNAMNRASRNVDQAIEAIQAAQPGPAEGHRVKALELLRQAKQELNQGERATAR